MTFSNSTQATMMAPIGHPQQPNHPYETKLRLLLSILNKIKNYRKLDMAYLENLMSVILEILKNVNAIF